MERIDSTLGVVYRKSKGETASRIFRARALLRRGAQSVFSDKAHLQFMQLRSPGTLESKLLPGCPELIALIAAEIRARGPMTFARFMELALYQPQHGYYASGRAEIGRGGDFFTNVSVGAIFGQLLTAQLREIWEQMGEPRPFHLVEQGASDGALAADLLGELRERHRDVFEAVIYTVIEPFAPWRSRQQKNLAPFAPGVRWVSTIHQMEPFAGVHLSNELFDALPTHLVQSLGNSKGVLWQERCVTVAADAFAFALTPIEDRELLSRVSQLPPRPAGYRTELNLAATRLMEAIAGKLERGLILAIDYGFNASDFYAEERTEGTLQVRAGHRKLHSPFEGIGCADISTHVAWSSLAQAVRAVPFGFADQHHFLTGILSGLSDEPAFWRSANKRALQTLLHPEMLGRSFQVLALAKNFSGALSGFRFARPSAEALGL